MKTAIIKASDGIHTIPLVTLRKIASGEMKITDLECWEPIMRTFVGVYLHAAEAGWISPDVPPMPEEPMVCENCGYATTILTSSGGKWRCVECARREEEREECPAPSCLSGDPITSAYEVCRG